MSEIRDRARIKLDDLYARHGRLNISSGTIALDDEGWEDFLSIPELAIVDREAKLPEPHMHPPEGALIRFVQDLSEAGYVKEVKD